MIHIYVDSQTFKQPHEEEVQSTESFLEDLENKLESGEITESQAAELIQDFVKRS